MCLIIASRNGSVVTDSELLKAYRANPDGWGIVWHNGRLLETRKGFNSSALLKAQAAAKGHPYVTHLRWATHGTINVGNCHPFRVNRKLWMAHNGVLSCVKIERENRSDTWHLAKLLSNVAPNELYNKSFQKTLSGVIGMSNKLAFIDINSTITMINESCGHWVKDIWLSNTHSIGAPERRERFVSRFDQRKWTRHDWERWAYYDEQDTASTDTWRDDYYHDTGMCAECGDSGEVFIDPESGLEYCEFCLRLF